MTRVRQGTLKGARRQRDLPRKHVGEQARRVVFFLQTGKMLGILILAQLFLKPFAHYILWVTKLIQQWVS